jgi:hypothetical protein
MATKEISVKKYVVRLSGEERERLEALLERKEPGTALGQILRRSDYLKFVASGILGVCAATTTLVVLAFYVQVFVAKLVSILVSFGANFTMSHFIVFRPREPTGRA